MTPLEGVGFAPIEMISLDNGGSLGLDSSTVAGVFANDKFTME